MNHQSLVAWHHHHYYVSWMMIKEQLGSGSYRFETRTPTHSTSVHHTMILLTTTSYWRGTGGTVL
jgi:hypothetical protein